MTNAVGNSVEVEALVTDHGKTLVNAFGIEALVTDHGKTYINVIVQECPVSQYTYGSQTYVTISSG